MAGGPGNRRVADELREWIRNHRLQPGAQLPSYAEIGEMYGVNEAVARSAVNLLRVEGTVETYQGKKGASVLQAPPATNGTPAEILDRLDELAATVAKLGEQTAAVKDLQQQVGELRAQVIDLYARTGQPYPRQQRKATRKAASG